MGVKVPAQSSFADGNPVLPEELRQSWKRDVALTGTKKRGFYPVEQIRDGFMTVG